MKHDVTELGIFGGRPLFDEHLHVGRPSLGDKRRLLERIDDVLESRWFTNHGPYNEEFEVRLAQFLDVRHCIVTCNATSALMILVQAIGLSGQVIVPSFTFVATAHALAWNRIEPVFCDVNPSTHTLEPVAVEELITARTSAILGVHLWGRPCDVDRLQAVADRHGVALIFDAAHAFGCSRQGRSVGGFGDAEVFSFHATKVVNSFEGGAIATDDEQLADKVRLMRNFGFADYDDVVCLGVNGKMSEASAAMGLTSLEAFDSFVAHNRRNHELYRSFLGDLPGVRMLGYDEGERNNYHYVVLEVDEALAGLSRDQLQVVLWAERVLARRYFFPGCHRMEPYRSKLSDPEQSLAVTERLVHEVLCLPSGTTVGRDAISGICQTIRLALSHGELVRRRLQEQAKGDGASDEDELVR